MTKSEIRECLLSIIFEVANSREMNFEKLLG